MSGIVSSLQGAQAGSLLKLSADLGHLLGDTLFSDTEVRLSDRASVLAHSAVLAARWPQFREVCGACVYVVPCNEIEESYIRINDIIVFSNSA